MHNFWENILGFLRFFISVLIGFFLTTFSPFFELFKNPIQQITAITITLLMSIILLQTLKLMLAVK